MEPSRAPRNLCVVPRVAACQTFASRRRVVVCGGRLLLRGVGQHQFCLWEKTCGNVGLPGLLGDLL